MSDALTPMARSAQFRVAVSALIFDGERILLALRRDIDWWNLPGGGMELGETVEEAVHREVREETGLLVAVVAVVTSLVVLLRAEKPRSYVQARFKQVRGVLPEPKQVRRSAQHMATRVSHLATRSDPARCQRSTHGARSKSADVPRYGRGDVGGG